MSVQFRSVAHHSSAFALCVALRDRILRFPLGLHFTEAEIEAEVDDFQLAAWQDGQLLACLSLKPLDAFTIKMRQLAVHENWQRQGIGQQLVWYAEDFAREHLYEKMVLHAREAAIAFYERLGYQAIGQRFTEVGLPHQAFEKELIL